MKIHSAQKELGSSVLGWLLVTGNYLLHVAKMRVCFVQPGLTEVEALKAGCGAIQSC